ncbi:small-conductance mechanosensitive channel [Janthinobacterium sp. CG_23.3]|uniref:hypothetical protein n=1 Tax=Janthinobacterium sp. CG_23.3 TaxID=3349634 RepID=UPI0038D3DC72
MTATTARNSATVNDNLPGSSLAARLLTLWRALRRERGASADAAAVAVPRAALEAALAEQQRKNAELARITLRQLDTIGAQAGRLQAMAAAQAATAGAAARLEDRLALVSHDKARERRASELLGAALARAHQRLETIPHLEADLSALRDRLAQQQAAEQRPTASLAREVS